MSQFPQGSAEDLTLSAAYPITIAALSAQLRGNPEDIALVLNAYHAEAHARGIRESTAWALLFSASISVMSSEIRDEAEQYSISESDVLRHIALDVANRAP